MRELLAGIVLILIVGIAGFFYRNIIEGSSMPSTLSSRSTVTSTAACPTDAKICPDGSVVGRTGPSCSFSPCAFPNSEIDLASTTLAFVLPAGYEKSQVDSNLSIIGAYTQSSTTDKASTITIYDFKIPTGEAGSAALLSNTQFASGLTATSSSEFTNIQLGKNVFSSIRIGATANQVQTAYYIQNATDLLRFDITERGVQNATDQSLNTNTLPQHQALLQMLATLEISSPK